MTAAPLNKLMGVLNLTKQTLFQESCRKRSPSISTVFMHLYSTLWDLCQTPCDQTAKNVSQLPLCALLAFWPMKWSFLDHFYNELFSLQVCLTEAMYNIAAGSELALQLSCIYGPWVGNIKGQYNINNLTKAVGKIHLQL